MNNHIGQTYGCTEVLKYTVQTELRAECRYKIRRTCCGDTYTVSYKQLNDIKLKNAKKCAKCLNPHLYGALL